jgi:hypothetical protein
MGVRVLFLLFSSHAVSFGDKDVAALTDGAV